MQTSTIAPPTLTRWLSTIERERMLADTRILCDSPFTGRRVGTAGHARASAWLMQQFQQLGWEVSTQDFPLTMPVLEVSSPLQCIQYSTEGDLLRALHHRSEFCEHPRSAFSPELKQGMATRLSETTNYRDAWVVLEAVPPGSALTELAARLAAQGAVGLLAPLYPGSDGYLVKRVMAGTSVDLPGLSVRADLLPTLIGTQVQANAPLRSHQPAGQNIVAWLPGSDPDLANEPLVLGAHYDGVGDDPGGLRLPGATDNAAAVAVLLEVARRVKMLPDAPRRPLALIAFDAEEVGAQGSRAAAQRFSEQGLTPSLLNLDGAACLQESVWVEPGARTETLVQALDQAGRWFEIPLILGNIASDHRQFTAAGLAAVGLSVGAAKLHTPGDTIELVQPEALQQAATLLTATLWQVVFSK